LTAVAGGFGGFGLHSHAGAFGAFGLGLASALAPAPAAAASASASASASSKSALPALTVEDSRAELSESEAAPFYEQFVAAALISARLAKDGATETAADKQTIRATLQSLYSALQYQPSGSAAAAGSSSAAAASASGGAAKECQSCSASWDADCHASKMENCGHADFCTDCFGQVVSIKIRDDAVMPWLGCPSAGCRHPLSANDIASVASTAQLARLCTAYMRRRLVRTEAFVSCKDGKCPCGFIAPLTKAGKAAKARRLSCPLCQLEQSVERGVEGELDEEFKKMIAAGTLRPWSVKTISR